MATPLDGLLCALAPQGHIRPTAWQFGSTVVELSRKWIFKFTITRADLWELTWPHCPPFSPGSPMSKMILCTYLVNRSNWITCSLLFCWALPVCLLLCRITNLFFPAIAVVVQVCSWLLQWTEFSHCMMWGGLDNWADWFVIMTCFPVHTHFCQGLTCLGHVLVEHLDTTLDISVEWRRDILEPIHQVAPTTIVFSRHKHARERQGSSCHGHLGVKTAWFRREEPKEVNWRGQFLIFWVSCLPTGLSNRAD